MARTWIVIASLLGFVAVALGAFGAHGLKARLSPEMMVVYQTGVQYHFYHALALLACAVLMQSGFDSAPLRYSACAFTAGIVLFSGSLYMLALTGQRWLGAVAPVGGLSFMAGWLLLALAAWRSSS